MPDGVTVIEAVVAPVDQRYDVPPLAVSVTGVEGHAVVGPVIVAVAGGFTVMVFDALFGQPVAFVTVTLYVVVPDGVTVIACVVAPVDHEYVEKPGPASSVTDPPGQVADAVALIVTAGGEHAATSATAENSEVPPSTVEQALSV